MLHTWLACIVSPQDGAGPGADAHAAGDHRSPGGMTHKTQCQQCAGMGGGVGCLEGMWAKLAVLIPAEP